MSSSVITGGSIKVRMNLVGNLLCIFNCMVEDPSSEVTTLITSFTNLLSASCNPLCFLNLTSGINPGDGESIVCILKKRIIFAE